MIHPNTTHRKYIYAEKFDTLGDVIEDIRKQDGIMNLKVRYIQGDARSTQSYEISYEKKDKTRVIISDEIFQKLLGFAQSIADHESFTAKEQEDARTLLRKIRKGY